MENEEQRRVLLEIPGGGPMFWLTYDAAYGGTAWRNIWLLVDADGEVRVSNSTTRPTVYTDGVGHGHVWGTEGGLLFQIRDAEVLSDVGNERQAVIVSGTRVLNDSRFVYLFMKELWLYDNNWRQACWQLSSLVVFPQSEIDPIPSIGKAAARKIRIRSQKTPQAPRMRVHNRGKGRV